MKLFENNINSLSRNTKNVISEIMQKDLRYQLIESINESEFFIEVNSNKIYEVRDEYSYEHRPNPKKRELYFVIGINSVKEIEELINEANKNSFFIILEPELSFLLSAMKTKDLSFLEKDNVMVVAQPLNNLPALLENLFTTLIVFLTSNVKFYPTYFYRTYNLSLYKEAVKIASTGIKYKLFTLGNSIEDSLIGLSHNIENIRYLRESLDVTKLKDKFLDVPAFIISAGPSLDKNIHYIKEVNGKGLIFAVDTILGRLLQEGIVPDFVLSIERIDEVYNYFYKDKKINEKVTLIAPPVIKPKIFQEFIGKKIIPMRDQVSEFRWFNNSVLELGQDAFVPMGSSVAHLAFGMAAYFGASPIVLVGQDLAFSDDPNKTHSKGTIYDKNKFSMLEETKVAVDGYYGGKVLSRKIWLDFKKWFEIQILERGLKVINATEGGAKIEYTEAKALKSVIAEYCKKEVNLELSLEKCPKYNLDLDKVLKKLNKEISLIKEINIKAASLNGMLKEISLRRKMKEEELLDTLSKLREVDPLLRAIYQHKLAIHNLQSHVVHIFRQLYDLEETLSYEMVYKNREILLDFTNIVEKVTEKIIEVIETNSKKIISNIE